MRRGRPVHRILKFDATDAGTGTGAEPAGSRTGGAGGITCSAGSISVAISDVTGAAGVAMMIDASTALAVGDWTVGESDPAAIAGGSTVAASKAEVRNPRTNRSNSACTSFRRRRHSSICGAGAPTLRGAASSHGASDSLAILSDPLSPSSVKLNRRRRKFDLRKSRSSEITAILMNRVVG